MATAHAVAHYQAQAAMASPVPRGQDVQERINRSRIREFERKQVAKYGPRPLVIPPRDASPDVLWRTMQELAARVRELEGHALDASPGDYINHLPFDEATVPVEWCYSDDGDIELQGVYIAGYWMPVELFSDEQRDEWIAAIDAAVESEYA